VGVLEILKQEEGYPRLLGYGIVQNYKWMAMTLHGINLE